MKYLLILVVLEDEYLITTSDDEKQISMEYFYYSYRGIKGLQVVKTESVKLPFEDSMKTGEDFSYIENFSEMITNILKQCQRITFDLLLQCLNQTFTKESLEIELQQLGEIGVVTIKQGFISYKEKE